MRLSVLLIFILFCSTVFGQHDATETDKPHNEHNALKTDNTHHEHAPIVTAQYAPTSHETSVYEIHSINSEEIQLLGATNLRELLLYKLDMEILQHPVYGSGIEFQGISEENIKILIDGVPVIGRNNGIIDLTQIKLNNIERVELIEGPTSVFYGTGSTAGTINLITKQSKKDNLGGGISTYAETIGEYNADGYIGFNKGNNALHLSGGGQYFKGYCDDENVRHDEWESREEYYADGFYTHYFKKLELRAGGRFFQEDLIELGEPDTNNLGKDIDYKTRRWSSEIGLKGDFGKHNFIDVVFSYKDYKRFKDAYITNLETDEQELSQNSSDHDTSKYNLWFFKGQYSTTNSDAKLNYSVGYEINLESAEEKNILDGEQSIQDYAIFGSLNYKPVEWLIIQPGLRWSYNSRYKAPLSPALNLKFDVNENAHLRVSYALGYRAPTLTELYRDESIHDGHDDYHIMGNEDLEAEKSHSVNVAYDHTIEFENKQSLKIAPSLFYNSFNNMIALSEIENHNSHYINVNKYKTHGGILRIKYKPLHNFVIGVGTSLLGRYNRYSEELDLKVYTYFSEFTSYAEYTFVKQKLSLAFRYKYCSERMGFMESHDTGEIEETRIESIHLLDFSIAKTFWDGLIKLNVGAKDLLDVRNLSLVETNSGVEHTELFLWGRSFYVNLRVSLNKSLKKSLNKVEIAH